MSQQGEAPGFDPSSLVALISSLSAQAKILMGEMDNPLTGQREEVDLGRARVIISTLEMLAEKTKGNLSPEEEHFLRTLLSDARLTYVRTQESRAG